MKSESKQYLVLSITLKAYGIKMRTIYYPLFILNVMATNIFIVIFMFKNESYALKSLCWMKLKIPYHSRALTCQNHQTLIELESSKFGGKRKLNTVEARRQDGRSSTCSRE